MRLFRVPSSAHWKQGLSLSKKSNFILGTELKTRIPKLRFHFYSTMNRKPSIRIGCGSGFWGDTPTAPGQLIKNGKLDYLILDYLSEITMSLLVRAKQKNPEIGGWCPDFVESVGPFLKQAKEQGIRIVTNAGGVNPTACMKTVLQVAEKVGLSKNDVKVALITGDDLLSQVDRHKTLLKDADLANITSSNAYLGAGPISRALDLGADIVITGRCTDSALALGPLIHEFGWSQSNYDLMSKGSLGGHLIECGAQSTGGIFTDWDSVKGWENNGFPIAVVEANGDLRVTKPEGTGGLVNKGTVAEQLVYEIGNPRAYKLPDVVCDWSQVTLTEEKGGNSVLVKGAKGHPPSKFYKVGGTFQDGWKATVVCPIIGPHTKEKGHKTAEAILTRCRHIFSLLRLPDFTRTHIQVLGTEESYGDRGRETNLMTREGMLWIGVHHKEKKALELFSKEIASAGTGMAPGLTTVIGGRPKPTPLIRFFSYMIPKDQVEVKIEMSDGYQEAWKEEEWNQEDDNKWEETNGSSVEEAEVKKGPHSYKLSYLAWLRSGDKGDACNIGVISRRPEYFPYIKEQLASATVKNCFKHKFEVVKQGVDDCQRYELPGIHGLNFVLENSLGGGGVASLTPDPQGKGYAQMLADFEIRNVPKLK